MGPKEKDHVGTSLGELLKDVELRSDAAPAAPAEKRVAERAPAVAAGPPARPSDGLRGDDRIAFQDAMVGVRPLERGSPNKPSRVTPRESTSADDEARARLAALVAGGVRFEVEREDDRVMGRRAGTPRARARELSGPGVAPEATLDLHGARADAAERELVRFVRREHRRGRRRLCIVHGKGLHSEGGVGVLADRVVHALTEGGAAPVVLAFATAHPELGGAGALIVQLVR